MDDDDHQYRFPESAADPAWAAVWSEPSTGVDAALDLAERPPAFDYGYSGADFEAAFASRFAGTPLSPLQRARLACVHSRVVLDAGDRDAAEAALNSAIDLFAAAGDELRRQETLGRLGSIMCMTRRGDRGLPMVLGSTEYVLAHGPADRASAAYLRLAGAYGGCGRVDDTLATLDLATQAADLNDDPLARHRVMILRCTQLLIAPGRDARADIDATLAACRSAGYRRGWAHASYLLGQYAYARKDTALALTAFEDAIAASDDGMVRSGAIRMRSVLLAPTDRAAEVIPDLIDQVARADAAGSPTERVRRTNLAKAYVAAGQPADAVDILVGIVSPADPLDASVAVQRELLGRAYRSLGRHGPAASQFDLLAAIAANRGEHQVAGLAYESAAHSCAAAGDGAATAVRFVRASEAFAQAGKDLLVARAARKAAAAYVSTGEVDQAARFLDIASTTLASLPDDEPDGDGERAMIADVSSRLLERQGRIDEAIPAAGYAISALYAAGRIDAANAAAIQYGRLLVTANRSAEAETPLRWVLSGAPNSSTRAAALLLCRTLSDLGRRREAEEVRHAYQLDLR